VRRTPVARPPCDVPRQVQTEAAVAGGRGRGMREFKGAIAGGREEHDEPERLLDLDEERERLAKERPALARERERQKLGGLPARAWPCLPPRRSA
jgi:hypothetical protein